jgi:hypothetical protein
VTTERENRKQRADKAKEPCYLMGREIKLSYYTIQDTHRETAKEVLKFLNRRYVPLWGHL